MSVELKPREQNDHKPTTDRAQMDRANDEQAEDQNAELESTGSRFLFFQVMPSWMTSFIIHLLVIIALAIFTLKLPQKITVSLESGKAAEDVFESEDISFDSLDYSETLDENTEVEETNQNELTQSLETIEIDETFDSTMSNLMEELENQNSLDAQAIAESGLLAAAENRLSGRTGATKTQLLRKNGGTPASENAVRLAMEWLKAHQLPNGSWSFDHRTGPGSHRTSKNPGLFGSAHNAATSMALLVFLGAGQTHVEGDYKDVVENGLAFLLRNGRMTRGGLSFYQDEGALYAHGLAAICLTEAYAMTEDMRLAEPAQAALRYIEYAQDPIGGGWRYEPKEPGDTSAVGWQIMALKSANMSGLTVSNQTIRGATKFLNFVQTESGAYYGYTRPSRQQRRRGTTAVGLLCRMYMGWSRENPALATGVDWLSDLGPQVGNWRPDMRNNVSEGQKSRFDAGMYYNYYATQVMRQFGGEKWDEWNSIMREFLVSTQSTEGVSKGSWFFHKPDLGYVHGGRLYATTLAAMTLEVYYRYLPLYDNEKTSDDEFELD